MSLAISRRSARECHSSSFKSAVTLMPGPRRYSPHTNLAALSLLTSRLVRSISMGQPRLVAIAGKRCLVFSRAIVIKVSHLQSEYDRLPLNKYLLAYTININITKYSPRIVFAKMFRKEMLSMPPCGGQKLRNIVANVFMLVTMCEAVVVSCVVTRWTGDGPSSRLT